MTLLGISQSQGPCQDGGETGSDQEIAPVRHVLNGAGQPTGQDQEKTK
jgi:hypothetical protein